VWEQGVRHDGANSSQRVDRCGVAGRGPRGGPRRRRHDDRARPLRRRPRRLAAQKPSGGEGTGKNPTDRGTLGWKWSIVTDTNGIPFGFAIDGANRNDSAVLAPTIDDAQGHLLLGAVETIWLDRGDDSEVTRERLAERPINDAVIAKKRKRGSKAPKTNQPMGLRWPVERTNSWLSNYGQLRRNTDRTTIHRVARLSLAVVFIITAKLIDWRNRWSPGSRPIR
jgi:hypothetical protein